MRICSLLVVASVALVAPRCFGNLGNDDSWFNGSLGPAPATPTFSSAYRYPVFIPQYQGPPPPTKEELEAKDLAESSEYFTDKGNKWFKSGKWEAAISFYERALKENPNNYEAEDRLKKARKNLADEKDSQLKEQLRVIAEAQRQFLIRRDAVITSDRQYHNDQLQRLMSEADHIRVPLPPGATPRHIHEGMILGLTDPQARAEMNLAGVPSPFTGRPIEKDTIFATAPNGNPTTEVLRGLLDNQTTGQFTLSTPYGQALVARLNGATFDRLIAHSNGGTVAEALIKAGIIKVDELNIAGGDRSLANQAGYQNLIDSGLVKRVVVWINPGDPIPVASSLAYVAPMGRINMAPLLTAAEHAAYALTGAGKGGDTRVEYRLLKGPGYVGQDLHADSSIFEAHDFKASYITNMTAFFAQSAK